MLIAFLNQLAQSTKQRHRMPQYPKRLVEADSPVRFPRPRGAKTNPFWTHFHTVHHMGTEWERWSSGTLDSPWGWKLLCQSRLGRALKSFKSYDNPHLCSASSPSSPVGLCNPHLLHYIKHFNAARPVGFSRSTFHRGTNICEGGQSPKTTPGKIKNTL